MKSMRDSRRFRYEEITGHAPVPFDHRERVPMGPGMGDLLIVMLELIGWCAWLLCKLVIVVLRLIGRGVWMAWKWLRRRW